MTKEGMISYQHLWYLFPKGSKAYIFQEDEIAGFLVQGSKYQKTMFAHQFVIQGEIIQTDGRKFFTVKKNFAIHQFPGTTKISSLHVKPMNDGLLEKLTQRGKMFQQYGM